MLTDHHVKFYQEKPLIQILENLENNCPLHVKTQQLHIKLFMSKNIHQQVARAIHIKCVCIKKFSCTLYS